jgi:methionyl-tRNA synthetase
LGNLASRTLTMIHQYRQGKIPERADQDIAHAAIGVVLRTQEKFDELDFSKRLEEAWELISSVDKYIVQKAPWKLARQNDEASQRELSDTLYTAAEALRIITALISPVLPESAAKIWKQLGINEPLESVRFETLAWGGLEPGQPIGEVSAVFPRIELKDAEAKMRALEIEVTAQQQAMLGKKPEAATPAAAPEGPAKIPVDDFIKVDLRVGLVLNAERVKNSDKLMHMTVDIGEPEPRTIVAGIAEAYTPEQLLNRKVVIVANLQPRKLKGILSNGMIVAASVEGGKPVLAGFHEDIPVGARLK